MFGDVAHGGLLFILGLILVLINDKVKHVQSIAPFLGARYILLLMGLFATFSGLMYNDFLSIPIEFLANSCYSDDSNKPEPDCVYPFGIDHRWYRTEVEITYVNSLKMKLSVIFGVGQMMLGILMKAFNSIQFKSKTDFICEFIPQFILLTVWFGYMDLLIIMKWVTNYDNYEYTAPSIITTMINIPLKAGLVEGRPFYSDYATNSQVSVILFLVGIIMIPIMLLPKPFIVNAQHKKHEQPKTHEDGYVKMDEEEDHFAAPDQPNLEPRGSNMQLHDSDEDEAHNTSAIMKDKYPALQSQEKDHAFSEIFIHQLIETIEFVLGTISNPASYL